MHIQQQGTRRRSSVAPTTGYVKQLIRDALADGSQLKLWEMEQKKYVTYNIKDGTYTLTDEGKRVLTGGQQ